MDLLALTGGTVIDARTGEYCRDQVVLVSGDRITAAGPPAAVAVPPAAVRCDISGRWLTAGLVDMHCHLTPLSDDVPVEFLLACGVTTVRDPGGPAAEQRLLRESVRDGRRPGPRILASGEILDGNPPVGPAGRILADTPERGRAAVAHLAAQGMDCIKVYNGITEEVLAAIISAAADAGLPVIGHVPRCLSMRRAVEMGMTGLEHIRITGLDFLPASQARQLDALPLGEREPTLWQLIDLDAGWLADLIAVLADHQVTLDPTLLVDEVVFGAGLAAQRDHPDNSWLPEATFRKWAAYTAQSQFAVPEALRGAAAGMLAKRKEFVARCAQAGVVIVAGTDGASLGELLPGFGLHRELALLRTCGLSARETLAAATTSAAHALGLAGQIGSIEAGKIADMAVWSADPLTAGTGPASVDLVIAGGQCLRPAELLDALATGDPAGDLEHGSPPGS